MYFQGHNKLTRLLSEFCILYHIYCMYSDRQARVNSVDPDENIESHQGLHSLPLTHPAIFGHNIGK